MLSRLFYGLLVSCLATTALANASPGHFGYAEFAYSGQNTDWPGYGDSSSRTSLLSVPLTSFFHVKGRYNDGSVSLPRGFRERRWWVYGGGFHHYLSKRTSLYVGALRHELESEAIHSGARSPTQRGDEYHIGIRHDLTPKLRLGLQVGEAEVIFKDTTLTGEGLYQLPAGLAVSVRVRDYDDLDLTEYELGLRWQFD